jgi:hypothetical protein
MDVDCSMQQGGIGIRSFFVPCSAFRRESCEKHYHECQNCGSLDVISTQTQKVSYDDERFTPLRAKV